MNNVFFQYYSLLIFLVCAITMVAVSYATEAPSYEQIKGLTFSTLSDEDRAETRDSWTKSDVIWSIVVLVMIMMAYLYFTG